MMPIIKDNTLEFLKEKKWKVLYYLPAFNEYNLYNVSVEFIGNDLVKTEDNNGHIVIFGRDKLVGIYSQNE